MSIKSELTKTTSYLRETRNAIKARGGQISDTAGFKDLPEAINSIPSGSSNNSPLPKIVDGSITEVTEEDLNGATKIRERAFYGCTKLVSAEIPDGVTSIEQYAFGECTSLDSVTMMSTNGCYVAKNAFSKSTNIKSVYGKDIESWCKIKFTGNTAGNPLYYGCDLYLNGELATNVTIPSTITELSATFYGCKSLKSVTISEGMSEVGGHAFAKCVNLERAVMPSTITDVAAYAFHACPNMVELDFSRAVAVPTLKTTTSFSSMNEAFQIKVPIALYDEWIAATNWASLAQYIVAVQGG